MKHKVYQFDKFTLDQNKRQLLIDDKEIFLTSKVFEILSLLVENNGSVIDKKEIFELIWSNNYVEESNLPVHISILRKLFKDYGSGKNLIKTVYGRGYVFTGEVRESLPPMKAKLLDENFTSNTSDSLEARDFCFKGQYIVNTISTRANHEGDLHQAIEFFEFAIKADPNLVEAYIGNSYALYYLNNLGYLSKEEASSRSKTLLKRAQLANPSKSEIYFLDGLISLVFDFNIPRAEKSFYKATELDSHQTLPVYWLGLLNLFLDNLETSRMYFLKALQMEPTNIGSRNGLVRVLYCEQEYNKALVEAKKVLEMDSRSYAALYFLALSYARMGIYDEALKYWQMLINYVDNFEVQLLGSYIYLLMGQPERASQLVKEIIADQKLLHINLYYVVLIYTTQNKIDEAFDLLYKHSSKCNTDILFIKADPGLKKLHNDRRFQAILKKLTLT